MNESIEIGEEHIFPSTSTSTIAAPRLCIGQFQSTNIDDNGLSVYSGHGSTVEFYSFHSGTTPNGYKFLTSSFDAFPQTKATIHGIFPLFKGKVLFCFGERECALLGLDEKLQVENRVNLHCQDWISSAKALDGNKIVLFLATNLVKLINMECLLSQKDKNLHLLDKIGEEIQLESRAIIISSLLHGDSWEELRVFAGTCFGAIHLFQPAIHGGKIVQSFMENNGMPFAIRCHANWLFSVGDDRSLRVWAIPEGKELFEKYAHGARPFALELLPQQRMAFTAGIDEYCCVWRWTENSNGIESLHLAQKIDLFGGTFGTIRCCWPVLGQNSLNSCILFLASERSGLASISLNQFNNTKNDSGTKQFGQLGKMNAFVFAIPNEGKCDGKSLFYCLDGKRQLQIHEWGKQNGRVLEFKHLLMLSNKINQMQSSTDEQFRADLFAYSQHAQALAVCSQSSLFVLKVTIGALKNEQTFCHVQMEGNFAQIIWIQPENSNLFMTISQDGKANLYKFCDDFSLKLASTFSPRFNPSTRTMPQIQSTLLVGNAADGNNNQLLFLGTRAGTILVFSLGNGGNESSCNFTLREAHGPNTVTALRLVHVRNESEGGMLMGEVHSLGRDGTLRRWQFAGGQMEQAEKFTLRLISMQRLNFEWPCSFFTDPKNGRAFIAGFQSDDFVLFDERINSLVHRSKCGGGNRRWQLAASGGDGKLKFSFAFTQKSVLNHIQFTPIEPPLHSENIVALSSFTNPKSGELFFLSGSLDRRILCSAVSMENGKTILSPLDSVEMHTSSVETVCIIPKPEDSGSGQGPLILTGGGRSELLFWRLQTENGNSPKFHFLFSHLIGKNIAGNGTASNLDMRILSICAINSESVVLCTSDGIIRLMRLHLAESTISQCAQFEIASLAMFSAIQIGCSDSEGTRLTSSLLFAISTSGHLQTFSVSIGLDEEKIHFIFVGSESGRVSVLTYNYEENNAENDGMKLIAFGEWHASTVTAIQTHSFPSNSPVVYVFSVALDCRLCMAKLDVDKNEFHTLRLIHMSISDPAALLVAQTKQIEEQSSRMRRNEENSNNILIGNSSSCFISGAGFEAINI